MQLCAKSSAWSDWAQSSESEKSCISKIFHSFQHAARQSGPEEKNAEAFSPMGSAELWAVLRPIALRAKSCINKIFHSFLPDSSVSSSPEAIVETSFFPRIREPRISTAFPSPDKRLMAAFFVLLSAFW